MQMTTTHIILLKSLNREQFKSIKEIQSELRAIGVSLSQRNIYVRLEKMATKNLCHREWQEGTRIYGLSRIGEWELDLFKTQLLARIKIKLNG
jgi:repressor of nif and glnA expression